MPDDDAGEHYPPRARPPRAPGLADVDAKLAALHDSSGAALDLSGIHVGDTAVERVAAALLADNKVKSLSLAESGFNDADAKKLAAALPSCSLERLELADNVLGTVGPRHLAGAIAPRSTIRSLGLSGCGLGAEGVEFFAQALKAGAPLTSLDVSCNGIGDCGAGHLALALEVSAGLCTLLMSENGIGDSGAEHMAASLGAAKSLKTLDMSYNVVRSRGADQLALALDNHRTMELLKLCCNCIGSADCERLAATWDGRLDVSGCIDDAADEAEGSDGLAGEDVQLYSPDGIDGKLEEWFDP